MIFQKYGNMNFAYRNREICCKGYYVDTVEKNAKVIKEYIENQIEYDKEKKLTNRQNNHFKRRFFFFCRSSLLVAVMLC